MTEKAVALYARVSTADQNTDNQMDRLREVAQNRGYTLFFEYVDVASGRNQSRPALDRLLDDCKAGKIGRIIATKLDRIARSVKNFIGYIEKLKQYNVSLEFLDQDIPDPTTPAGKFTMNVLVAVAELEWELIHDRTMDGVRHAQQHGTKSGKPIGKPPVKLTAYQIEKAKQIIAENPNISQRKLADQFEGIGRTKLIEALKIEGILV